jgi:ribosomal protein L11 methyltransferase
MSKPAAPLWRIEVIVPASSVDAVESALEPFVETVSWFMADPAGEDTAPWRLEGFSRTPVERTALAAALALAGAAAGAEVPPATVERVSDTDWVTANLRSFPPIRAGRFFVHGSHFAGRRPGGSIGLLIDAGTAFGSGEHATTVGCLLAIDRLLRRRRFQRPLDLGCGTGILAIALAKAGCTRVRAADVDPVAVRVAAMNARRNGVGARVAASVSDGYASRDIARHRPYDLIVANILARPLVSMAADLSRHLAEDGVAILSGLLTRSERLVLSAHRMQGLSLEARFSINGWSTLVLSRR